MSTCDEPVGRGAVNYLCDEDKGHDGPCASKDDPVSLRERERWASAQEVIGDQKPRPTSTTPVPDSPDFDAFPETTPTRPGEGGSARQPADDPPLFTKSNLPRGDWGLYRKKVPTAMTRVNMPFVVETMHDGLVRCDDGWVAVDQHGYPYPIRADEHAMSYELSDESP